MLKTLYIFSFLSRSFGYLHQCFIFLKTFYIFSFYMILLFQFSYFIQITAKFRRDKDKGFPPYRDWRKP